MKKVLITGASGGIGLALTERFASEGCLVYAHYCSHREGLERLTEQYPGLVYPVSADLCRSEEVTAMFAELERLGSPEVLINNAGIAYFGLLQDMTDENWDRLFGVNLRGAFLCTKAALPAMIEAHRGVILNISSMWGERGASCEVAYSASKGGLNAFTRALAKELGPSGIRVNALSCGVIDTAMNDRLNEDEKKDLSEGIGLLRFGTPAEAAEAAWWLCSEKASYVSGAVMDIDGCFI